MSDSSFYKQATLPDFSVENTPPPPMPAFIGPYKIESLLNKGGMSLLYLGLHPETKQPLVIKVLSPQFVNHQEMVNRFIKEAEIIALTNHPNIVELYGQGAWEGGLYIAMQFIRGVSLCQFIMQQSLSLKRSLDIILQVAYALLHLHTHGVIHRDLKPENILITEDGEIKVIDFGIAQLHTDLEAQKKPSENRMMGTPSYMSPEQKEDPLKVTYSSDIYSLGIITYELVIGKLSYGMIDLALLPKGLQKIVGKALAVSLKERYQDIVDFITDISNYFKSGALEKDRPGSDQLKEVFETLQKASYNLSPSLLPEWEQLDLGIAKYKGPGHFGFYYDFFKFPNNSYLILLAETAAADIDALVYMGILRGMIRTLIHEKSPTSKEPFNPLLFTASLNRLLLEDSIAQKFAMSFVLLDPYTEQLSFVSCGLGNLIHLEQGNKTPRELSSPNPLLGIDVQGDFASTTDNWNVGDTIILHSLETALTPPPASTNLHEILLEAIAESAFLSAGRQAEAILKKASSFPSFSVQRQPKAVISIQRIS